MYFVEWILENRIVVTRPVGDQTKETFADSVNRLQGLMDAGDAPVHVISDSRFVGKFPTDLSVMRKLVSHHEKNGETVIVGGNSLSNFIAKLLTQFSGGKNPHFADSIENGLQWLQSIDASLPGDIDYEDYRAN